MFYLNILEISILFLILFIGIFKIGKITNKLTLQREDEQGQNIIIGFIVLYFLIGVELALKLYNSTSIVLVIFVSFLIFIIKYLKSLEYLKKKINNFSFIKFLLSDYIIIFGILIFIFFSSVKNNFFTLDDIGGYFYNINNYIQNFDIYEGDLRHRDYYSYPFYFVFNSIIISFSDFYSSTLLDIFFGSAIILFVVHRNLTKIYKIKPIVLLIVFLIFTTYLETNSPKILITALIITILFELQLFFKKNNSLVYIFILSSFLISLKFVALAAFTNTLLFFLIAKKILKNEINKKIFFKSLFLSTILLSPWIIYSFNIFSTPLSEIINSPYHYFNNLFFKELDIKILNNLNYFEYFFSRQISLTLLMFIFYFKLCEENIFFKISLFLSFLITYIFIGIVILPDDYNFLRYMQPFYASINIYLFINIINEKFLKKLNFKSVVIFLIISFLVIRTNQNITIYFFNSLNNLNYLITNDYKKFYEKAQKFENIQELYPKNYSSELNHLTSLVMNTNIALFISRPYLFDFKNNQNKVIDYIEYGFGYAITKNPYPLNQNKSRKDEFFKKRNIRYVLLEKKYLNIDIPKLIYVNIKRGNNIIKNSELRSMRSLKDELMYYDLYKYLLIEADKILVEETENFKLLKIIY